MMRSLLTRGPMMPQFMGLQQAASGLSASLDSAATSTGASPIDSQRRSTSTSSGLPSPATLTASMLCNRRFPSLLSASNTSLLSAAAAAANPARHSGAAAGPPLEPGRDVWAEMRAAGTFENRNSLGAGYYSMIIIFGFASLMHDIHAYPPRVIAMMGLVTFMLYSRR